MSRRLMRIIAGLLAGVVALAGLSSAAADDGVTADTIKLGGFFIESGPVGELGITLLKAVKAVFNDVNASGGIYGRKLQLVDCDTSFTSGDKPRACYTKLTQQDKMRQCAKQATGKKGPERKAFMKGCLSKKKA